ncbi:MAG: hypothetical protein IH945_12775, partial [Armatimonadetes bacterium]|nr:hypothetical protein [Armatimonadota bacterium]
MEPRAKTMVRAIVRGTLVLGVMPYVAYLVSLQLFGTAILVGPYLVVSPLLAVMVLSGLFYLRWFIERRINASVADPALSETANRFALELGMSQVSVFFQPNDGENHPVAVRMDKDEMYVMVRPWSQLNEAEREFGIAKTLTFKHKWRRPWEIQRWLWLLALFAGCVIASQNLWSILVTHTVGLVGIVYLQDLLTKRTTIA